MVVKDDPGDFLRGRRFSFFTRQLIDFGVLPIFMPILY